MDDDHLLRRIRWDNVARVGALVLIAALVALWPRLRSPEPDLALTAPVPAAAAGAAADRELGFEQATPAGREPRLDVPAPAVERAGRRPRTSRGAREGVRRPRRATGRPRPTRPGPTRRAHARRAPHAPRRRAAPARPIAPRPAPRSAPRPAPRPSPRPPSPAGRRPVLPATTEFAPARREFGRRR